MRRILSLALLAVVLAAGPGLAQDERRITVIGQAEVASVPDMATVTVGFESEAETAGEALAATAEQMQQVFAALEAAGVAEADIQTSQLALGPVRADRPGEESGPPETVGYRATNLVTVTVREVDQVGPVIDALGPAGANRMSGITFEVSDPKPQLDEARRLAVADAAARAELLAGAAGVSLGDVMSIRELGSGGGPIAMRMEADMAMAMPIAEGTVSLRAEVEVVYAIE